jgi:O-methyltransferase
MSQEANITEQNQNLLVEYLRRAYGRVLFFRNIIGDLRFGSREALEDSWRLARAIIAVQPHTEYTTVANLRNLHRCARLLDAESVAGDFVECGVYQGATAAILGEAIRKTPSRSLWLFDSFQGLPAPTAIDGAAAPEYTGKLVGNEQNVRRLLRKAGAPSDRVKVIAGWFKDTLPQASVRKVALLHIDADWYDSVRLCLECFYDRIAPGGIIVLDDWDWWPGCKAAVEEFVAARGTPFTLQRSGGAPWFRKPR